MNNTKNGIVRSFLTAIAGIYVAAVLYVVGELFIKGTTGGFASMTVLYASLFISTSWSITYIYNVWTSKTRNTISTQETNYRNNNKFGA